MLAAAALALGTVGVTAAAVPNMLYDGPSVSTAMSYHGAPQIMIGD